MLAARDLGSRPSTAQEASHMRSLAGLKHQNGGPPAKLLPQHGGGAAAEGASCSRGAQQGRLQIWSYQQWKWILGQDKHFGRRRRRPIWHSDRPHGGWLGQAPRGGIASALQPWHRETQRSARGGVAQHDVLSGSATGRVCVSYVCGSAVHGARAPRTTGECVWSPFSRCFDRAWGGPLT